MLADTVGDNAGGNGIAEAPDARLEAAGGEDEGCFIVTGFSSPLSAALVGVASGVATGGSPVAVPLLSAAVVLLSASWLARRPFSRAAAAFASANVIRFFGACAGSGEEGGASCFEAFDFGELRDVAEAMLPRCAAGDEGT